MTRLGSAYVDIRPDFSKFWPEVAAQMGGFDGKSIGNAIGTSVGKSAGASVSKELKRASKQLTAVADNTGQDIADGLLRGLNSAKTEINAFARDGAASLNALKRVGAEVTGSLEAPIKRVNLFARDGAASFTAVGKAARGASAEITGSFDPASKALQRVDADMTGAVEHVGKALRGVSSDATGGFDTATRKINLFGKDGIASFSDVGNSARDSNAEIKALYAGITTSNISRALGDIGTAGTKAGEEIERGVKRGSDAVRNLNRTASGGGGGIGNSLGALGDQLPGGVAAIGGLRIALVLVVPALIAFGGAAGAAASALVPLIGLAASAGSVLAAAAQGFGVFKLATAGIGAALKEQTTNQVKSGSAAINAAGQQRSAARAISNAQDAIRTALDGVTSAEDDLKDAQRNARAAQKALNGVRTGARRALTDMHAALTDAVLSEKDAALGLKDAQQALGELATTASQHEISVAIQDVTEALHGQAAAALSLLHAQQDLNDLINRSAADQATQASTAAALARAQENYAKVSADQNATYDERTYALSLVADATKAVNDANKAATVTELDKADALLAVSTAQDGIVAAQNRAIDSQQALSDLQNGPSDLDKQHALLDVAQAVQGLVEAQRDAARQTKDLTEADRLGVEGSKDVVDAKAAIVEANKRVDDAEKSLKDAHDQVAKATLALSDAQLAANEALAKGADATQNLNKAFDALPPAAQTFVKALVAMKPQLDDLRQTAAQGFFPGATAGLQAAMGSFKEIKTVIAETATVLGDFTRKSGELVGSPAFGKDLKTIGHNNAETIDTLGEALRHVISAIRYVLIAAAPLTKWLADTINDWAKYAASSAKAGQESGRLAGFFERTRAIASRLGDIIGHLVHGLWGVATSGDKVGNDIWKAIDRVAKRFDAWANSVKGQKSIHDFFRDATDLAGSLTKAFAGIADGIAFFTLKLLPLNEAMKLLGPYAGDAAVAFLSFKAATITWSAIAAASAFATGGFAGAFASLNAAMAANPIGVVVLAVAALAAGLIYAYKHSETFRDIVDGAFKFVKESAEAVWNFIESHWKLLFVILTGPIGLAALFIASKWDWISNATSNAWHFIWNVISGAVNGIKSVVTTVLNALGAAMGPIWSGIRAVAGPAWEGIKSVIFDPIKGLVKAIGNVWDDIRTGAGKAWDLIVKEAGAFATTIVDAVAGAVKGAANLVIDFINDIIGAINVIPGIPNIDPIKHIGESKKKDKPVQPGKPGSNTQGTANKAQGGAYGRTGGFVGAPITLMGEEAPKFPEWVIPTNPAYRKRAHMLLGQAARSIGLATGGRFSQAAMEALWDKHGGGDKKIAGAVGMAESGGDPNAANGPYHGLWQIGPGGSFDPDQNAIQGIAKWRASGWAPWEAYTGPDGIGSDGPWQKFAKGGGGVLGAIGGALGQIGGVLGDLLSKGASFVLSRLPGLGDLPDWIKPTGKYVLDHVGDWIKDKVTNLTGGGGGTKGAKGVGSFGGVPMANWVIEALTYGRAHGAHGNPTSGYRPGIDPHTASGNSEHQGTQYPHGAVDFGGYDSGLAEKMSYVNATRNFKYPLLAPIGFHDNGHASGTGHYMGGIYRGSFGAGGIVGGPPGAPAIITAHGGEALVPDGSGLVGALREHAAELRMLRQSGVSGVMSSISDHVLQRGGDESQRRRATAGNPSVTAIFS